MELGIDLCHVVSFHDEVDHYRRHVWRCDVSNLRYIYDKVEAENRFYRVLAKTDRHTLVL